MTTDATDSKPEILTQAGPATGRLAGVNHIQLIVSDMDQSVRFYRDILGMTVIRTTADYPAPGRGYQILKNTFLDMGNGNLLSLIVIGGPGISGAPKHAEPSVSAEWLWPGVPEQQWTPRKFDHLAFNVDTHEDVVWFKEHLESHGVKTSKIIARDYEAWVESLYFYDPDGIPVEIATFDRSHPKWDEHRPTDWFRDPDPVPALRVDQP
ncbi:MULTISPECIES: VOC family protein [Rhodococcus]|uniref:VOC family protein n=1 Tax=Rhodococcus aetherivorans TaxID=191292 RepID=A0AA46PB90_9NOCA|nr:MULTISPECIES: VOC family protein [Rhodococcus]QIX52314.1 VOC family protein [Rhodococcus sp. DMU1]UYF95095.1 VOC family protein [Rhodococcus aetherivorans]